MFTKLTMIYMLLSHKQIYSYLSWFYFLFLICYVCAQFCATNKPKNNKLKRSLVSKLFDSILVLLKKKWNENNFFSGLK